MGREVWVLVLAVAGACDSDAALPDANPADLDGDGVLNEVDNCPGRANVDQHDEDADAIGDTCDNCPTVANASQADTTEAAVNEQFPDGVGDACDLRPGLAGDQIAAFYSFANPTQANSWVGTGWSIADDALIGGPAQWSSKRGELGDGVMAVAEISTLAWSAAAGEFSLAIDGDGINFGATCLLRQDSDSDGRDELVVADRAGGATTTVALAKAIVADEPITVVAWRSITGVSRIGEIHCEVRHAGSTTVAKVSLVDDTGSGAQGIAVTAASARIASLIVYTSPGPKSP